jgi:hypothetical protein
MGDNIPYRDAIASPRSRNGSRGLGLMSRLRVNSGTACGGITQEHAARFSIDFVCSAFATSQCRAQTPPSWFSMSSGGGVPCHKYLDRGRLTSRDQIIFSFAAGMLSRCATNLAEYYLRVAYGSMESGPVGTQDGASIEN